MHGVQPNAKASPTTYAPTRPSGRAVTLARFSESRKGILKTPAVCRPRTMIRTPPIIPNVRLCSCSSAPMSVAAAPRATKTVEKPRTNARLVSTTRRTRSRGAPPSLNWATFTPLMKDR